MIELKKRGQPRKPYTTKILSFRVRVEWSDAIKNIVKEKIKELNK